MVLFSRTDDIPYHFIDFDDCCVDFYLVFALLCTSINYLFNTFRCDVSHRTQFLELDPFEHFHAIIITHLYSSMGLNIAFLSHEIESLAQFTCVH